MRVKAGLVGVTRGDARAIGHVAECMSEKEGKFRIRPRREYERMKKKKWRKAGKNYEGRNNIP